MTLTVHSSGPGGAGWLAGLNDRYVGAALALVHGRPGEHWTVERLARQVGLSRSALAERFSQVVGEPIFGFLTQVRLQLASILKAVISQRLVPRADGKGRVPALEVLISTARVRECISDKERTKEIHDAISKGFTTYGMQTFDQSLMHLVKSGLVTYEEALKHVSNPDDFALRFRGIASSSDGTWDDFEKDGDEDEQEAKPEPQAAAAAPAPPAGAAGKGGRPQPEKAGKATAAEDDPGFKIERF